MIPIVIILNHILQLPHKHQAKILPFLCFTIVPADGKKIFFFLSELLVAFKNKLLNIVKLGTQKIIPQNIVQIRTLEFYPPKIGNSVPLGSNIIFIYFSQYTYILGLTKNPMHFQLKKTTTKKNNKTCTNQGET